ncbi:MAG: efflux RND transporter permease subunit, partial [Cyanobacteria bacterium J06598_3]
MTIFCWIAIAVIGLFALSSLKYALFPDITFPVVVVSAKIPAEPSPQADPETTFATTTSALDIESQVAIPLERQLQSIEGLKQIVSSTFPGRSVATLHFRVGESLVQATSAVSDKISQAALSPEIAFEVIPFNLNEATVASYAIFSDQRSLTALADFAETDILPTLRDIPGVLRVDLLGRGTQNAAASDVSAANLQQSPTLIHFDGEQALAVQIVKRGDANTLEVAGAVDSEIQQLQERVSDVDFSLATTQADYIRAATRATIDSLIGAIAIAVLVIFGFLRSWRATLITALAIPLSLLGTCIVMAIFGFNLETITLLALALVIGIIVDDAIVEVENITRHIELGESPKQAALKASEEIGLTVSASTLTIVAVFLPVAFMGGTIGQFFKPFGLTVSAAVLISLLVARTLSPVLAASWLKPTPVPKVSAATVKRFSNNGSGTYAPSSLALPVSNASIPAASISKAERRYSQLLRWALYHRWMVVGMAIACLIAGLTLIPFIPKGFIPQLDRGEFYLNYAIPLPQVPADFNQRALASNAQPLDLPVAPDIPADRPADIPADPRERILQTTLTTAEQLEEKVFQLPEVASVLSTVGGQGKPNEGQLYITLSDDRARDTATVQTQLREELAAIAGVTTSVENVPFVETRGEKPLRVALLGDDLSVLNQTAVDVKAAVENISGLVDVQISGAGNTADEIVEIDRENGQRVAYISANLSSQVALGDATDEVVAITQSVIPPESLPRSMRISGGMTD